MPRYRRQFWDRSFLVEMFGAIIVVSGMAGFWTADRWAGPLAALIFRI